MFTMKRPLSGNGEGFLCRLAPTGSLVGQALLAPDVILVKPQEGLTYFTLLRAMRFGTAEEDVANQIHSIGNARAAVAIGVSET